MYFRALLNARTGLFKTAIRSYKASGVPELTEVRHNVKRGNYATLEGKDIAFFESIVGGTNVLQDDLQGYNVDFLRSVRGNSQLVLKPSSVQEVSAILKHCNERRLAVCPQSGNTGLVGGSVPVCDEIVLSLQRLNKIISIDEMTGIAVAESGVILENLDNSARDVGYLVPLDLGAKSSCLIGGNVSTNAGGLRVIRYGNLHGSVLGVEVVLANGKVLDLMSDFKKDNTGYHLKHMFIGSEGTLGVVTKVAMLCPHASDAVHVAFLGLNSFDDVLKTFLNAKRYLGEILSACEMIDGPGLATSLEYSKSNSPIDEYPFYMLIETSGSNADHDMEKFTKFLENGMEKGEIIDGTITAELGKCREIWKLRELVPVALIVDGFCFKYDISLPLRDFYNIVNVMRDRAGNLATRVCGYGHLGDSNLHLNVSCKEFTQELYKQIEPFVYEYTAQLKGSVSAEHGIGFLKTNYLKYSKAPAAIGMMHELKHLLDPNGILNPYKVLANGQVMDLVSDFKKDNTGYHLKHMFIGSEGTLGVVTKVSILCPPAAKAIHVAFLGLSSFDHVLRTFKGAQRSLGEILSACEMLDAETLKASVNYFKLNSPIGDYPFYMLIETSGSNEQHDLEKMHSFLEHGMNKGEILDGTITSDTSKVTEIWHLREWAPVALINSTFCYCYDISVPLREFYNTVEMLKERVADLDALVVGFGHLGDSNLHVIVSCPDFQRQTYERLEPFLYEHTAKFRGSFSAEHGVGFMKRNYLKYAKTSEAILTMRQLKQLMDPNAILNPYKMFN